MTEETASTLGRILVVDDDPVICRLLARVLRGRYAVTAVAQASQALRLFRPGQYSVALVDLGMRSLPGDRMARQMRQIDPTVATILITGWELEDDDPRRHACDFYLHKPFGDLEELEATVARAVELHQQRRGG
ncbi:MAG: response regulator [Candidatus Latescibacterota bacterium]